MPARGTVERPVVTTAQWERSQFYRCRTFGHAWFDYDTSLIGVALALRCERCGTDRLDSIDEGTGELIRRKYTYAPGYAYGSDAVPTRDEFRMMLLRQRMDESRKARRKSS